MPRAIGENKKCSKCGEWKHVSAFSRSRATKDGYTCSCKECVAIVSRRHYDEHKEDYESRGKKWRQENRERHLAASRAWKQKNPDKVAEQKRRYRSKPETRAIEAAYYIKWRLENPEKAQIMNRNARLRKRDRYSFMKGLLENLGYDVNQLYKEMKNATSS